MGTYTKALPSGSIYGRGITISSTGSTTGNLIHTAVAGTTNLDEIWVSAVNISTASVNLTLCWGGTVALNQITKTIPPYEGLTGIVDGRLLQNGNTVTAFAGTTNALVVYAYVHTITP